MNNKEEISLQLFICFIWCLMSSVERFLAGKHQFMSQDMQSSVSLHLLPDGNISRLQHICKRIPARHMTSVWREAASGSVAVL